MLTKKPKRMTLVEGFFSANNCTKSPSCLLQPYP